MKPTVHDMLARLQTQMQRFWERAEDYRQAKDHVLADLWSYRFRELEGRERELLDIIRNERLRNG